MKIVRLFLEHGAVANIAAGDINLFISYFSITEIFGKLLIHSVIFSPFISGLPKAFIV
jgi:hypothetical protein